MELSKRIEEIVKLHGDAEVEGDLEALMATLGEHPVYDVDAMNMHVEGREAVRAMYAGLIETGFFEFDNLGSWTNDTGVVREDIIHWKVEPGDVIFGITFDSPKEFDLRVISILNIDLDTIDSDQLLMKGERVIWDGNYMFTQLGIDPKSVLG